VMHDRLADHRPKPRHAVGEPFRHVTVMQRQIRASPIFGSLFQPHETDHPNLERRMMS
jgi:hypothetical protein